MRQIVSLSTAAALLLGTAAAQDFTTDVDPRPDGGLEEISAVYFAEPPQEEAAEAVSAETLDGAGAVALAISLGRVEEALEECRGLRRDMQRLIGDTYGSYSVNPGWLKRYQSCVLARSEETRAIGTAIRLRQRELIAANTDADEGTEEAEAALRAADLMARLSARQSAVKLAIRREARKQKALVQYYNTGEMPEALKERPRRPAVAVPAGETPLNGPAPVRIEGVPLQRGDVIELRPEPGKAPLEGAIVMPDAEEAESAPAADALADGAPMPLRTED